MTAGGCGYHINYNLNCTNLNAVSDDIAFNNKYVSANCAPEEDNKTQRVPTIHKTKPPGHAK